MLTATTISCIIQSKMDGFIMGEGEEKLLSQFQEEARRYNLILLNTPNITQYTQYYSIHLILLNTPNIT